jgi:hypothetical protein
VLKYCVGFLVGAFLVAALLGFVFREPIRQRVREWVNDPPQESGWPQLSEKERKEEKERFDRGMKDWKKRTDDSLKRSRESLRKHGWTEQEINELDKRIREAGDDEEKQAEIQEDALRKHAAKQAAK